MQQRGITPHVAAKLIASQFPQWASLPIQSVTIDGWDNTTLRLGNELSIRLPNHEAYVPQVEKEHRWLPVLARHLPLSIPQPVALGCPTDAFPRPWSVYRWLDGNTASLAEIANLNTFAFELADFLKALYSIDASGGPPPGGHNFYRGGRLHIYDGESRDAIRVLGRDLNGDAVIEVWEAALASSWDRQPVWVHGDVSPSNLLVREGRLRGVIDFGCLGVGDPACDLTIAWTFFIEKDSRNVFRTTLKLDDRTWARARGWTLWKALITLAAEKRGAAMAQVATIRQGWRCNAREVIELLIADYNP